MDEQYKCGTSAGVSVEKGEIFKKGYLVQRRRDKTSD